MGFFCLTHRTKFRELFLVDTWALTLQKEPHFVRWRGTDRSMPHRVGSARALLGDRKQRVSATGHWFSRICAEGCGNRCPVGCAAGGGPGPPQRHLILGQWRTALQGLKSPQALWGVEATGSPCCTCSSRLGAFTHCALRMLIAACSFF